MTDIEREIIKLKREYDLSEKECDELLRKGMNIIEEEMR